MTMTLWCYLRKARTQRVSVFPVNTIKFVPTHHGQTQSGCRSVQVCSSAQDLIRLYTASRRYGMGLSLWYIYLLWYNSLWNYTTTNKYTTMKVTLIDITHGTIIVHDRFVRVKTPGIARATILVLSHRVPDLQVSCCDLNNWWDTGLVFPVMAAGATVWGLPGLLLTQILTMPASRLVHGYVINST